MRERIFIVPVPGVSVRDPNTKQYIPADGAEVERSSYWIRRQLAGEITIGKPAVKKTAVKKGGITVGNFIQ